MIGSLGGGIVASKFGRKLSNAVGSTLQIFGILAASMSILWSDCLYDNDIIRKYYIMHLILLFESSPI